MVRPVGFVSVAGVALERYDLMLQLHKAGLILHNANSGVIQLLQKLVTGSRLLPIDSRLLPCVQREIENLTTLPLQSGVRIFSCGDGSYVIGLQYDVSSFDPDQPQTRSIDLGRLVGIHGNVRAALSGLSLQFISSEIQFFTLPVCLP